MIKACGNYIIIKEYYEQNTIGGIIIPDAFQKENSISRGVVISIGPEFSLINAIDIGSKIIFRKNEGTPIEINEKQFLALKEEWVLGIEHN